MTDEEYEEGGNPHQRYDGWGIRAALDDVEEFHRGSGQFVLDETRPPGLTRRGMRRRLLEEEVRELFEAVDSNDLDEVADAYADIVYIVLGSALMHFGKERFVRVWDAVHESNMAKRFPNGQFACDSSGKIMKPPEWRPPDIAQALRGSQ